VPNFNIIEAFLTPFDCPKILGKKKKETFISSYSSQAIHLGVSSSKNLKKYP